MEGTTKCDLVYINELGTSCCRNILNEGHCRYGDKCIKKSYHKLCYIICEFNRIINEKEQEGTQHTLLSFENDKLEKQNKNLESLLEHLKTTIGNLERRNNKLDKENDKLDKENEELKNKNKHLNTLLEEIILNNNLTN